MMKSMFYLSALISMLLLSNCNKDSFVSEDEIPQWLKERIIEDEAIIDSAPKLLPNYGAWIRYKYKKDFYFEYDNPLSSVMLEVYDYEGDGFDFYDDALIKAYQDNKCCKRYVWKAPEYLEFN